MIKFKNNSIKLDFYFGFQICFFEYVKIDI